jgi:hypothetical protein
MDGTTDAPCKRCGHTVERVTAVAPNQRDPGIVAWVCPACGAADSVLVYLPRDVTTQFRSGFKLG